MASRTLVGALVPVHLRVRGGERAGEVRVVVKGLPRYYLAYSAQPIEVGEQEPLLHESTAPSSAHGRSGSRSSTRNSISISALKQRMKGA